MSHSATGRAPVERIASSVTNRHLVRKLVTIRRLVRAASAKASLAPWETPYGLLRRLAYRLVREARSDGTLDLIYDYVTQNCWVPPSPTFEDNPFHWCLVALTYGSDVNLSRATRRRFGNELLFADRHDVPELYLLGFIYQLGSALDIHERVRKRGKARMVTAIERGR